MSVYIEALINPIAYLSEQEKHSQQLAVLEDAEFSVQSNEEHQFHHPATRRFQTTGGKQELSPCVYRGSHKATNN
nr:uncharacterized protein LOC117688933 isoform X2 [Crassostrea gigas]